MKKNNLKTRQVGNGEGSLYYSETLEKWVFQYFVNGKRKTLKQKNNEKVKDFKARVTKVKNEINTNSYIESSNESFYDILKNYIEQKYKDGLVSARTYNRDLSSLKQVENTCSNFIYKPIQKIKSKDIEDAKKNMRIYSNSVIEKIWSFINKTFSIAYSRRKIQFNIMNDETLIKPLSSKEQKKIEALTQSEENVLVETLNNQEKDHKYRKIILLQLWTGMRIGEILALSLDCIDLNNNTITIYRTLTTDEKGNIIIGEHTKTYSRAYGVDKGKRTFPITEKVRNLIDEILKDYIENQNKLLFWDKKNNCCIKHYEINLYLNRISKKYKITASSLTSHRLRHTFITRCFELGINLKAIQMIVGHIDGSAITTDVYVTASNDYISKELEKIK